MKAVAFLQNMWVKNPERTKAAFAKHGENFRLLYMKYALFRGCITGRRLRLVFGKQCDEIIWEETTREIAGDPKTIFPADHLHMVDVLRTYKPPIVLTFGRIAEEAMLYLQENHGTTVESLKWIRAPHPAARQPNTLEKLKEAAEKLRKEQP